LLCVKHSEMDVQIHRNNVTDIAGCEFFPDEIIRGQATARHILHQKQLPALRINDQFFSLFPIHCHWRLAQNMFAMS